MERGAQKGRFEQGPKEQLVGGEQVVSGSGELGIEGSGMKYKPGKFGPHNEEFGLHPKGEANNIELFIRKMRYIFYIDK